MHLRARFCFPELLGPGEGGLCFGGPSKGLESEAFIVPEINKVGITFDGFVVGFDGFTVPA